MQNHRMSVWMQPEAVGIATVNTILTEDLELYKICAKEETSAVDDWSMLVPPG